MRRGREKDQLLARLGGDATDKVIALLLAVGRAGGSGAGMRLIDDDQFRTLLDEDIAAGVGLDEVDTDDLEGVILIDAGIALNLPIQPRLGIGANDDRFDIKLGADLGLPLLAQVRQADDCEALDLPPLQQFLDDKQGLQPFCRHRRRRRPAGGPIPAAAP